MKKPKTLKDLKNDPRIESVDKTGSNEAPFVALTKYPYLFHGNSRSILGNIGEICEDMTELHECPEKWYE